ncbi:MAG: hypothetical protein ACYTDY_10600 [Planctomycetota bacterium]|jgi:hypothetical protein
MIRTTLVVLIALTALAVAEERSPVPSDRLAAPTRIHVGDRPIDVDVGHATPFVVDLDGDGKKDLLVGQFAGGKVRHYRNVGTDAVPKFVGYEYVGAGEVMASVPVS